MALARAGVLGLSWANGWGGHCVGLPGEAGKAIKATGVLRALRARALLIYLRIEGLFVFMKKH